MSVLIFATLAVAAVSCNTIFQTEKPPAEPPTWCRPNSNYSASTYDVYGGGTCYCNDDGSIAHCHTVYSGSNFSFTQTSSDKRGNLGMCLSDGTCFKLPQKKDLANLQCPPLIQPSLCTAQQDGRTYEFYIGGVDDFVDGSVVINGTYYGILPIMTNGRRRTYM